MLRKEYGPQIRVLVDRGRAEMLQQGLRAASAILEIWETGDCKEHGKLLALFSCHSGMGADSSELQEVKNKLEEKFGDKAGEVCDVWERARAGYLRVAA